MIFCCILSWIVWGNYSKIVFLVFVLFFNNDLHLKIGSLFLLVRRNSGVYVYAVFCADYGFGKEEGKEGTCAKDQSFFLIHVGFF